MRTSSWGVPTVLVLVLTMMASGRAGADFVVLPPHATVEGATLQEWVLNWSVWTNSFPADTNPNLDPTGARGSVGDVGPVFFLATVITPVAPGLPLPSELTATRTVTVPADKFIFFPLVVADVGPDPGQTIEQLRADLDRIFAAPIELHATIDKVAVPDLSSHREISPVHGAPNDLVKSQFEQLGFAIPPFIFPLITDGYWLMLEPLPPGPHDLNFGGTIRVGDTPIRFDVTYNLNIVPEPSSLTLLGLGVLGLLGYAWHHRTRATS
jgi:hypothetical protein